MAMRNLASRWGGVRSRSRSRGRVVGVRHMTMMQVGVGGGGGDDGAVVAGGAGAATTPPTTTTTEEEAAAAAGKGAEMAEAYSSSSPQDQKERLDDKPQPSPRAVRQNAKLVKDSMNTKNI